MCNVCGFGLQWNESNFCDVRLMHTGQHEIMKNELKDLYRQLNKNVLISLRPMVEVCELIIPIVHFQTYLHGYRFRG